MEIVERLVRGDVRALARTISLVEEDSPDAIGVLRAVFGIPFGTLAIGRPGATNAALLAVAILANARPALREKLRAFREEQTAKVLGETLP